MKKNIFLFLVFLFLMGTVKVEAAYITIPANTGIVQLSSNDYCWLHTDGTVKGLNPTGCVLAFPINIESGKTLTTIDLYYYDNIGSQYIDASLGFTSLSTNSFSYFGGFTDTTTSPSVQIKTISYGAATLSTYSYWVCVYLLNDTVLRGIRINYF